MICYILKLAMLMLLSANYWKKLVLSELFFSPCQYHSKLLIMFWSIIDRWVKFKLRKQNPHNWQLADIIGGYGLTGKGVKV